MIKSETVTVRTTKRTHIKLTKSDILAFVVSKLGDDIPRAARVYTDAATGDSFDVALNDKDEFLHVTWEDVDHDQDQGEDVSYG